MSIPTPTPLSDATNRWSTTCAACANVEASSNTESPGDGLAMTRPVTEREVVGAANVSKVWHAPMQEATAKGPFNKWRFAAINVLKERDFVFLFAVSRVSQGPTMTGSSPNSAVTVM